jgi:hypothetical protein
MCIFFSPAGNQLTLPFAPHPLEQLRRPERVVEEAGRIADSNTILSTFELGKQ